MGCGNRSKVAVISIERERKTERVRERERKRGGENSLHISKDSSQDIFPRWQTTFHKYQYKYYNQMMFPKGCGNKT